MRYINKFLKLFGKRLTNYHAPTKPFYEGVAFLKTVIHDPDWVIDIGVATGTPELYEHYEMQHYNYLLIEADPRYETHLQHYQLKYPNTVNVEKCFCDAVDGETVFSQNSDGRSSSRYNVAVDSVAISVPTKKLDTIVCERGIQGTILLKIDVEGAEVDVLKGATEVLKKCEIIIVESWITVMGRDKTPSDFASLVSVMKQNGFVVFDIFGGHAYDTGILKMVDLVFIREEEHTIFQQRKS